MGSNALEIEEMTELNIDDVNPPRSWRDPGMQYAGLILLLYLLAFAGVNPFMPSIVASFFSRASLYLGWMVSLNNVTTLLTGPLIGVVSDRYGRKPVLLFSAIGLVVSILGLWLGLLFGSEALEASDREKTRNYSFVGATFGPIDTSPSLRTHISPEKAHMKLILKLLDWLYTVQDISKIKDLQIFNKAMPHSGHYETRWRQEYLPNLGQFFSLNQLVHPDSVTFAWTVVPCISREVIASQPQIERHLRKITVDDVVQHLTHLTIRVISKYGTDDRMCETLYREITNSLDWIVKNRRPADSNKLRSLRFVHNVTHGIWMTPDQIDFNINTEDEDAFVVRLPEYLEPYKLLMEQCGASRSSASLSIKIYPPARPNPAVYNFSEYFMKREMADAFYVWENRELPAHKIILANHSAVFKRQFESFNDRRMMLESEEHFVAMEKILKYLYTGIMDDPHQEFGAILELSRRYMLQAVQKEMEIAMFPRCAQLSIDNLLHLFGYAREFKMDALGRYTRALLDAKKDVIMRKDKGELVYVEHSTLVEIFGSQFAKEVEVVAKKKGLQCDPKKCNFRVDEELAGLPKEDPPMRELNMVPLKTEAKMEEIAPAPTVRTAPRNFHNDANVQPRQQVPQQKVPVKKAVAPAVLFEFAARKQQDVTQVRGYKTKNCTYFLKGKCVREDDCTYIHDKQKKKFYK
ncbi:Drug resistance transporter [Planoprotostelium fungivorum]|uniref:Drug resistance transporter n=1 Tax=Planoprotostelium fungivorum TaxID=1890364 RepID=A0A2P6P0D7_9EUKA|nr:Drug resistance transporter [Planoprotostelium fungivorum]